MRGKPRAQLRWFAYFVVTVLYLYFGTNVFRVIRTPWIYQEVSHPDWSRRVCYDYGQQDVGGQAYTWLIDIRRITVPPLEAREFYVRESDRVGLRECHVGTPEEILTHYRSTLPELNTKCTLIKNDAVVEGDILVLFQYFPPDSTIRR